MYAGCATSGCARRHGRTSERGDPKPRGRRRLFAGHATRAFASFERAARSPTRCWSTAAATGCSRTSTRRPRRAAAGLATAVIAAVLHAARAERHEAVFVPTEADGGARAVRAPRLPAAGGPAPLHEGRVSAGSARSPGGTATTPRVCERGSSRGSTAPWCGRPTCRRTTTTTSYGSRAPIPGLEAAALAAVAEPALAGLAPPAHRGEDEAAGARAVGRFRRWAGARERLAFLTRELPGPAPAPRRRGAARGVFEATVAARGLAGGSRPGATRRFAPSRRPSAGAAGPARRSATPAASRRFAAFSRPATPSRSSSCSACPSAATAASAARSWRARWRRRGRRARARRSSRPTTTAPPSASTSGSASAPSARCSFTWPDLPRARPARGPWNQSSPLESAAAAGEVPAARR